jgi:Flp pilus assembly protein TadG
VEFAIICSLLFLIVFGIIEFSIILYDKAVLTNASREGARAGIVFEKDRNLTSVTARVNEAVARYAPNLINFGGTASISSNVVIGGGPTGPSATAGQPLTVSLEYTYNFLIFPDLSNIFGGSFSPTLTLQAQTVMRLE